MTEAGKDEIASLTLAMTERERGSNCKNRAERREMIRFANEITRQEENIDI